MSQPGGSVRKLYRFNLQFQDIDHPLLAGEMDKFPKGKRRHSRLLNLATLGLTYEALARAGLLSEQDPIAPTGIPHGVEDRTWPNPNRKAAIEISMSEDDVRDLLGDQVT